MTELYILKNRTLRHVVLIIAGGLALGAAVTTIFNAAPRPVDIVATVEDPELRERGSSLIIESEGEIVAEVDSLHGARETERLEFHFWLSPQPHRLELRLDGCPPEVRTFNPKDGGIVAFAYRCGGED